MMRKLSAVLLLTALAATSAVADIVYVTGTCSNAVSTSVCGSKINTDVNASGTPVYQDISVFDYTSAKSTKPDGPATPGARYTSNGSTMSNTSPDSLAFTISPDLGVPGGVYRLYHIYSSINLNVNTNAIMGVVGVAGCTLNFSETDKFQTSYGTAVNGKNVYQLLGYVTNNPGVSNPSIGFYWKSGLISGAITTGRILVDTFKFVLNDPCLDVPTVGVTGPLVVGQNTVVVTGVSNAATQITVYQDSGSGMVQIGSLTSGIVGGNNIVPVTGLVAGAQVAATQTLFGQASCPPTSGLLVGGGANPPVRLCLSIRETSSTGPVGAPGNTASSVIHFLGASTTAGGAPTDSMIIYPSNGWQTVTFTARQGIANVAHAAGTPADISSSGYVANDSVALRVYAYQASPLSGVTVYSATPAQATAVTRNTGFVVNWSWDAVPGVDGYRLLRNVNGAGYLQYVDVPGTTTFIDENSAWSGGSTVTPTMAQVLPSVVWNGTGGTANNIATKWGILESLAFSPVNDTESGPYDIYIDNLQNGSTVFETFENAPAGTTDYGFRVPGFSGTTSGNILTVPNDGSVTNLVADTGTKSFRIQFQWQVMKSWLRLTTSGVNNPQVNLDNPVSIRMLLLPKGASRPAPPAAPVLSASTIAGKKVLSWTGGHRLQTAVNVSDTYTNVTQSLSANTWTNITLGGFLSPWTNNFTEPTRFFRLKD